MTVEQLLTPRQVADRTTLHVSTLSGWRKTGRGPRWIRLGRRIGYPESAVEAWLESGRADHVAKPA